MAEFKLLFVEDDANFSYIIKNSLELTGNYEIQTAANGQEGLETYYIFNPDVIVADIEMPVLDGMAMVDKIRSIDRLIPILLASGQSKAQNVLKGYDLKVDNFIKKPYIPEELDAHIQAVMRRTNAILYTLENKRIIHIGEYIFNADKQILHYKNDTCKLSGRETLILTKLCENKGKLILREEILEEIWNVNDFFTSRSLDVFINTLRKRLARDPRVKIETIRGKGFILNIN
jgi:DNA-binding response OmpR family regulator